ncbi:MAG: hypothetical protein B6D64_02995 [Bacteroidetes bacterium 4484_276]|nr:MAG: hypothetical protein B6D64_02995 [Bacteroidetes bacterium 4484_276]
MKQQFFLFAMLCSISAFSQLSDAENKALDKLISSKVEIEADALKSSAINALFDAEFFTLKRTPHYNENGGYSETILMKQSGKMVEVSDAEMLVPSIKSSYKLSSETEARQLKDALALLLVSATGSENEIVQKGEQWILVCEDWFGEKKGFVVTTENGGKINKIEYSGELEL